MAIIDTASPGIQDVYLEKRFLVQLNNALRAGVLGTPAMIPEGHGKTARWTFLTPATAEVTPLTEGSDPASDSAPTINEVDEPLQEYGAFFDYSKWYKKTAQAGMFVQFIDWSGYQGALSYDTLIHTTALADTTNNITAVAAMTGAHMRAGAQNLVDSAVRHNPATPGGQYYCALFSSEAAYDMMGEGAPGWSTAKQENVENSFLSPFEDSGIGSVIYGLIVKIDLQVQRNTTPSPDTDLNFIVGMDAFGVTTVVGENAIAPELQIITPQENVAKKLKNSGSIGWNGFWATELLQNNALVGVPTDATGVG